MRAVAINRFGGRDTLEIVDLPVPELGDNDVRVALAFAAVNPADWKFREGWGRRFPTFRESFSFVLGLEGVGIVDKVGHAVTRFAAGDRVAIRCNLRAGLPGSYAQFAVTDQDAVAAIPDAVTMVDAATVPVAGVTGYQAVVHAGGLRASMAVLIHGGAGGVGSFALQVAKARGARVAATCSARNIGYVQGMGADLAIDYAGFVADEVLRWASDGVEMLIDCVGMRTLADPLALLAPGGIDVRIVTLTDSDDESPTPAEAAARGRRAVVKVVDQATAAVDMAALMAMIADGQVRAPDTDILPLGRAAEAHRRLEERQVRGKLLLEIG